MSEPTDKAERDRRRLTLNSRMPTERFCLRLMDQVTALEAENERLLAASGVLRQLVSQDERWKRPMPGLEDKDAVYVWCLKAQEELGELSAALLGQVIGKEGRGDPLEETDQLIAVLLRVRKALKEQPHD